MEKNKKHTSRSFVTPENSDYNDFEDMLESGMNDYEIARELGISDSEVARMKRELYND